MKKVVLLFIVISSFFFLLNTSNAQQTGTAEIKSVISTNYPWIKADYVVWDSLGQDMRISNADEIVITEGGKPKAHRPALSPNCPPPGDRCFSAIFVLDVSESMVNNPISSSDPTTRRTVVLQALRNFCRYIDTTKSEVAITAFANTALLQTGFTNSPDSLYKIINKIPSGIGTNYNSAFLVNTRPIGTRDSTQSGIYIAKSARCKPVIIFITDGKHEPAWAIPQDGGEPRDGRFMIGDVVRLCHAAKPSIYVFVIKIGDEVLDGTNLGYLNTLANIEIGREPSGNPAKNLWSPILSSLELETAFLYIADVCGTVGYPKPCEVQWKTDCGGGGEIKLDFPAYNTSAIASFTIPDNIKPVLEINPKEIVFVGDIPVRKTLKITAKNNFAELWGFSSSDPKYKIVDWGIKGSPTFTLNKGESATITIEYTPTDSLPSSASIELLGTACSAKLINALGISSLYPDIVDLGDVFVNTQKDSLVLNTFCNKGTSNLTINSNSLKGVSSPSANISFVPFTLPVTLTPDECLSVRFGFNPKTIGEHQVLLVLETSSGTFNIVVKGNGIEEQDVNDNSENNAGCLTLKPNPAGSQVEISFVSIETGSCKIWITDIFGNKVSEIFNERISGADKKSLLYNTSTLSSGFYFVIMQTNAHTIRKKLSIIK
ncbi:MAG: VWA domain-containing protein [Bacteroidota bacterium]